LIACVALAMFASCAPAAPVCCTDDVDCDQSSRCFEGRCAARCDDDSQCNAGETCQAPADVCAETNPDADTLARCPYHPPPVVGP
jgi:hypothetical protein